MKDRLILEFPNTIPPEKVEWLRNCMRSNLHLGRGDMYNREGNTIDIGKNAVSNPLFAEIDSYLSGIFSEIARKAFDVYRPPFTTGDSGYEYHLYKPGEVCKEHVDGEFTLGVSVYQPDHSISNSLIRCATAVIYLTDNTDGGGLVFPDSDVTILPEAGKAVVFPPYGAYRHYSTPSKNDREILMTWFVYANVNAVIV